MISAVKPDEPASTFNNVTTPTSQTIAEGHWPSQAARGCVEASHGAMIGSLRDALSREASSHRDQGE